MHKVILNILVYKGVCLHTYFEDKCVQQMKDELWLALKAMEEAAGPFTLRANNSKHSVWLGTSTMTDRETPLAKIVGQMSLSKKYKTFRPNPVSSSV